MRVLWSCLYTPGFPEFLQSQLGMYAMHVVLLLKINKNCDDAIIITVSMQFAWKCWYIGIHAVCLEMLVHWCPCSLLGNAGTLVSMQFAWKCWYIGIHAVCLEMLVHWYPCSLLGNAGTLVSVQYAWKCWYTGIHAVCSEMLVHWYIGTLVFDILCIALHFSYFSFISARLFFTWSPFIGNKRCKWKIPSTVPSANWVVASGNIERCSRVDLVLLGVASESRRFLFAFVYSSCGGYHGIWLLREQSFGFCVV